MQRWLDRLFADASVVVLQILAQPPLNKQKDPHNKKKRRDENDLGKKAKKPKHSEVRIFFQ